MLPGLASILIAGAWLLPNHYSPWLAAWGDAAAIAGLILLLGWTATRAVRGASLSWPLALVAALSSAVLVAQGLSDKVLFAGDALLAGLYVCLWAAAVLAGRMLADPAQDEAALTAVVSAWFFAALLSVGIALVQWTGALNLGIYGAEMPPNGRPFGNLGQPNHLNTVCFLGLCSLAWMHQRRKVGRAGLWAGMSMLLFGMAMAQSRTGWLQIGLLVAWVVAMNRRATLRLSRGQGVLLGVVFVLVTLAWPVFQDALLLSGGRSQGEQIQAGTRVQHWVSMVDAIGREPWSGYGWQQVGLARQRVALDHPGVGEYIEHSHSMVLDLLVWNGIPVGGLLVAALVVWFVLQIRACKDAGAAWMLAAVGGVWTHALLEYPLEYAYFLIPTGLAMGAAERLSLAAREVFVPRRVLWAATTVLAGSCAWIGLEYLEAEENDRMLRLETAKIGVSGIVTPAADLQLLTQLGAYLKFARTEEKPGMSAEQLDWMRRVSERFGYQSVLLRYAIAAGLNGQPVVAEQTLARLCRIHTQELCKQALTTWSATAARQYPQLTGIPLPPMP